MLIEDRELLRQVERVVSELTSNLTLRDDLRQEALIHLWTLQDEQPGQTKSWYLQNCRFHLLHFLALGRSIDSPKRRATQVQPPEQNDESDAWLDRFATTDLVREAVNVRDMVASLSTLLSSLEVQILHCCTEGFGNREIAKRLDISHPTVRKHRRRIAKSAKRLSI